MTASEHSRFKIVPGDFKPDGTLTEDRGWHKMDVRWLVTSNNMPSTQTVVGKTAMPPGVKAQHALHRHPNAEEWEYVVQGVGIKHVGGELFCCAPATLPSSRAMNTTPSKTRPTPRR